MPLLSQLSFVSFCKETTQGTSASTYNGGATTPLYIPVQDAQGEEVVHYVTDDSIDNNSSLVKGVFQGERDSTFTYTGLLYPEIMGPHFVALGFADTYTASNSSSHQLQIPSTGAQPPTITLGDFDNVSFRQWAGQMLDQWDLTIDARGAIKHTTKWLGWTSASTSTPTATIPSAPPFLGWQTAITVGGVACTRLVSAGITIKRGVEVIHTLNNTQNPSSVFAGPAEVTYKVQAIVDNYTEWNQLINNTQPAFRITTVNTGGSSGGGGISTFVASSASSAWTKATINRKGKYMMLDAELVGIYNSTDKGPAQFSINNLGTAAY